jgi:AraC family transcriptional regulator
MNYTLATFPDRITGQVLPSDSEHQLLIVLSGNPNVIFTDQLSPTKTLRVEPKNIFTIPSFYPEYEFQFTNRTKEPVELLSLKIEPLYLRDVAHQTGRSTSVELLPIDACDDEHLFQVAMLLKQEHDAAGGEATPLFLQSIKQLIAIHVLRQYSTAEMRTLPRVSPLSTFMMTKIDAFINEHLDKEISLEDLAQIAGYSPFHFSRCFKAKTSETPYRYVVAQRINAAKKILSSGKSSVLETAWQVGFQNPSYFAKVFQKITGVRPSHFKRRSKMMPAR